MVRNRGPYGLSPPSGGHGRQQPDQTLDGVVAASSLKRAKMLNLLLCTLNWETLGQPKAPPSCAQLGAPISKQQHGVIERLEALLTHYLRMPQFDGHELGRAAGKFQGLIDLLQELPDLHSGSEDLFELLTELHKSFDPYKSHFPNPQKPSCPAHKSTVTVSMPSAKPVEAARVNGKIRQALMLQNIWIP
eukprot:s765_g35.t1